MFQHHSTPRYTRLLSFASDNFTSTILVPHWNGYIVYETAGVCHFPSFFWSNNEHDMTTACDRRVAVAQAQCSHATNEKSELDENENCRDEIWNVSGNDVQHTMNWKTKHTAEAASDGDEMLENFCCSVVVLLFHHLCLWHSLDMGAERRREEVERVKNCLFMYETNCFESKVSNSKIHTTLLLLLLQRHSLPKERYGELNSRAKMLR